MIDDKQLEEWERAAKYEISPGVINIYGPYPRRVLDLLELVRRLREVNARLQKLVGETLADNAASGNYKRASYKSRRPSSGELL